MKTTLLILVSALVLSACSRGGEVASWGIDGTIKIWTDEATGCQYILTDDMMTPRLNAAGHPVCGPALRP